MMVATKPIIDRMVPIYVRDSKVVRIDLFIIIGSSTLTEMSYEKFWIIYFSVTKCYQPQDRQSLSNDYKDKL